MSFLGSLCLLSASIHAQIEAPAPPDARPLPKTGFEKVSQLEEKTPFGIIAVALPKAEYIAKEKLSRAEVEVGYIFEQPTSETQTWTIRTQPFIRNEMAIRSAELYYARKFGGGLRFFFKHKESKVEYFVEGLYSTPLQKWGSGSDLESALLFRTGVDIPLPIGGRHSPGKDYKMEYRETIQVSVDSAADFPKTAASVSEAQYLNARVIAAYVGQILEAHKKHPSSKANERGAVFPDNKTELPALMIYRLALIETQLNLSKLDKALLLREPLPELQAIKAEERHLWRSLVAYSVLSS